MDTITLEAARNHLKRVLVEGDEEDIARAECAYLNLLEELRS